MANSLLSHHIKTLRLREEAPFPSQSEDAQQMIREWRHANLVRRLDSSACILDAESGDDDPLFQGDAE